MSEVTHYDVTGWACDIVLELATEKAKYLARRRRRKQIAAVAILAAGWITAAALILDRTGDKP